MLGLINKCSFSVRLGVFEVSLGGLFVQTW